MSLCSTDESKQRLFITRDKNDSFALRELIYLTDLLYLYPDLTSTGGLLEKCLCTWGVVQNFCPPNQPPTTVVPTTDQTAPTTDHLPEIADHRS